MSPIVREYFRVPRDDRTAYIHPPPAELPALIERNRRLLGSYAFALAGRPVQEFRAAARAEAMALARQYAERWGFKVDRERPGPAPVIVTGHQPPPFHPGVWIKNFLTGGLARAVGGVGLNLIVDNDEARGQTARFPVRAEEGGMPRPQTRLGEPLLPGHVSGKGDSMSPHEAARQTAGKPWACHPGEVSLDEVRTAEVALASAGGLALEEQGAAALDTVAFDEIARSVPPALAGPWRRFAGLLKAAAVACASAGEALAVARRQLEEELGLRNLELPVSRMADSEAFRFFVAWMLAEHEGVFEAYNGALAEYRRVYRERSAAQPVPDLARDGRRVELPLWIWRAGEKRRRLWAEAGEGGAIALFADHERIGVLEDGAVRARRGPVRRAYSAEAAASAAKAGSLGEGGSGGASSYVAQLAALRQAGWKVRPRALSMTLFVRLAVGDVFIHGLGGALYDKISDALFERLWGVRPPELILASCTVRLPLEAYPATPRDLERARRRVRDWQFNPDRLSPGRPACVRPEFQALAAEKRRLIENRAATRPERYRAFLRIHDVNAALAALDPAGPAAARADLERIGRHLRYNAVLRDREYPFCFYPAEDLAAFYREATRI